MFTRQETYTSEQIQRSSFSKLSNGLSELCSWSGEPYAPLVLLSAGKLIFEGTRTLLGSVYKAREHYFLAHSGEYWESLLTRYFQRTSCTADPYIPIIRNQTDSKS